jgi:hypothetical protein
MLSKQMLYLFIQIKIISNNMITKCKSTYSDSKFSNIFTATLILLWYIYLQNSVIELLDFFLLFDIWYAIAHLNTPKSFANHWQIQSNHDSIYSSLNKIVSNSQIRVRFYWTDFFSIKQNFFQNWRTLLMNSSCINLVFIDNCLLSNTFLLIKN